MWLTTLTLFAWAIDFHYCCSSAELNDQLFSSINTSDHFASSSNIFRLTGFWSTCVTQHPRWHGLQPSLVSFFPSKKKINKTNWKSLRDYALDVTRQWTILAQMKPVKIFSLTSFPERAIVQRTWYTAAANVWARGRARVKMIRMRRSPKSR